MVVTRSARPQASIQATSAESSGQKNSAKRIQAHLKGRKESPSDGSSTAESQSTKKQSPVPRTPKTGKRKSRTTGSLPKMNKLSTDGETSEAESSSSVSEPQDPILRVTRRRKILVACTPVSSVRKKLKITPINESHTEEELSEAESHVSGISRIVPLTVVTTRTRRIKAKSLTDPSQESHAEAINEPDFSNNEICNDFDDDSFHGNSGKKLTVQKGQHFNIQEEKLASVAPLKERKQNCKSLTEEAEGVIDEGKEINEKNSELTGLSELQDTNLQQLVSQRHSTPQSNKTTSKPSNLNCEAIMKSLAQTFAVVEIDRWTEERKSTIKTSDLTSSDGGGSDEECTVIAVSDNMNKERNVDFECDAKSQDTGASVLLLSSSDESQQSENSEIEEDTVCFVENSGQNESLNGDSENRLSDNALFVIDTTPGLSTDKNFYLDEEDKASEVAIEEEEEEEDEKSEEEPSDHDKNKDDEFSDEDDLLNGTKSKLLKLTSSSIDPGLSIKQLGGLYINFNADKLHSNKKTLTQIQEKKKNEFLQKAIITPDFEKKDCVPPYRESKYQLQKKRRKERQKTAGDGWFGMKAPELTDELKNDLKALKMRASMDPKRFYKKNDRDGFPKYFQIGTIVDNPADFYHSRIPKKQRKKTIVEELLADSEFRRYNRRKYSEIMAEKAANAAGKKFRKKKKFRN
ncbi:Deoxynucleotidyltransferase terminal-interacting protein 2 [Pteropus alecto]|uniref:Deoxynucleotidyltransferase terminal-interacting protein 2 n=1 Tax=Pteropus alecto TaxID=9402 RepID=L5K3Q8_PTEAL|nr:Deoxynucleotidyltransferase terminal-interacting protein 2 [Pteropus alecto]